MPATLDVISNPPIGQEATKGKTKAKQRYLKKKKDRRKHRKAVSANKRADFGPKDDVMGEVDEQEEQAVVKEAIREEEARPRKRRRVTQVVDDIETEPATASDLPPVPKARRSTPHPALPSFPLPALPNAPSKTDLALQGLDKNLVEAEIVDSATLLPISAEGDDDAGTGLTQRTRKRLMELGIKELFAVQTALVPFLLPCDPAKRALYLPYDPPRDVCVSAPTGSGKTLAYVLPIVEILSTRIVTRLRALIVLPTRDLVTQVRETFEQVSRGRGLKIGTATGQHSFAHEQTQLIAEKSPCLQGGSSKMDILICTPGRLIDHLNGSPNFSLQHLRFLVIDEADRLLAQSFQDWLSRVLSATRAPLHPPGSLTDSLSFPRPDAMAPHFFPIPPNRTDIDEKNSPSMQKMLFSATLTSDPAKIVAMELRNPKYFVVQSAGRREGILSVAMEKFTLPSGLSEHMISCEPSQKPLMLFHLAHNHGVTNALVFTKSTESTARLVRLFKFFEDAWASAAKMDQVNANRQALVIRAYSSDLAVTERKTILEKFKAQDIHILVCSDLISRGIDISHVSHVVSYDVPVDMRKYVHRVGRTARAGRAGDAWTLVESQEARHFKSMLKEADHWVKVKRTRASEKSLAPLIPHYEVALSQLKEAYGH